MAAPPRSAPATNPFIPPRAYATCGSPSIAAEESRQATITVLLLASRPILLAIGFEFGIMSAPSPWPTDSNAFPKKSQFALVAEAPLRFNTFAKKTVRFRKPKRRRDRRRSGLAGSISSLMCLNPAAESPAASADDNARRRCGRAKYLGRLVLRFRSLHHFAAPSRANFGIKGALASICF